MNKPRTLQSIGQAATSVAKPILQKHGSAAASLMQDWNTVVGEEFAAHSFPQKLVLEKSLGQEGILYLSVTGSWIAEFQHKHLTILQRVNSYFGYAVVHRIVMSRGYTTKLHPKYSPFVTNKILTAEQEQFLHHHLETIEDPEWRRIFEEFGRSMMSRCDRNS